VTVVAAAALVAAPLPSAPIERYYSTGWYAWLQPRLTAASDLLPWAVLDVLVGGILAVAMVREVTAVRRGRRTSRLRTWSFWAHHAIFLLTVAAAAYLAFLVLWGLNYRRAPLEQRIDFDAGQITTERVVGLARRATSALNALYADSHATAWPPIDALPDVLGPQLAAVSRQLGLRWSPRPGRPKHTLLAPYFRWAAVAGMTNPFGLEVLPSADTLPFERHAVMAHEWAHLAGFAHEAEAGFVGWLLCLQGDQQARYSGWLSVWSSLVSATPAAARTEIARQLGPGPRKDLQAIAARNARAIPAVRRTAWRGYDAYLRSQHVREGVASYEGVVRLLAGFRPLGPTRNTR
jgi:hypothetical protein